MKYITFGEIMLRLKSPGNERFFRSTFLEATFGDGANRRPSLACGDGSGRMQGFEFDHLGINADGIENAGKIASAFEVFGMVKKVGSSSTYLNYEIEVMHNGKRGACGHIGFKTWNAERAAAYLSQFGLTLDTGSVKPDEKGRIRVCYLTNRSAGSPSI